MWGFATCSTYEWNPVATVAGTAGLIILAQVLSLPSVSVSRLPNTANIGHDPFSRHALQTEVSQRLSNNAVPSLFIFICKRLFRSHIHSLEVKKA